MSIKEYLARSNINPAKVKAYYGMYFSPFRPETVPSFKVDFRKNLWVDFGLGEGGTLIDLIMKLNNCTFPEAAKKVENKDIYTVPFEQIPKKSASSILVKDILPLTHQALISYLSERKICIDTAKFQCVEVHYSVNDKNFFAVGFRNDLNGYELRNRYFKGSVSPKAITTFDPGTNDCLIFEGFMDYLSYLTMQKIWLPDTDTVVLNSVVHLDKAGNFLKKHDRIRCCLDNDEPGRRTLKEIEKGHQHVINLSDFYSDHKDLNEFLCKQAQN